MATTKVDRELEARAESHADDPERAELIQRARRFKASWLELAEALTEVARRGRFRSWGYESVEDYAKKELHLRPDTVAKLTASYAFLRKRAPEVLTRDALTEKIPSYQAVEFLRRAEEQEAAPKATLEEVKRKVLDESVPYSSVSREYRAKLFPLEPPQKRTQVKAAATRLRELMRESPDLPAAVRDSVESALARLLEVLGSDAEAA